MISRVGSIVLALAGSAIFTWAERLSDLEKRLKVAHPWTKVTGWSGAKKGVLAWRCVGIMLILLGLFLWLNR
jgi:hypothetical protein